MQNKRQAIVLWNTSGHPQPWTVAASLSSSSLLSHSRSSPALALHSQQHGFACITQKQWEAGRSHMFNFGSYFLHHFCLYSQIWPPFLGAPSVMLRQPWQSSPKAKAGVATWSTWDSWNLHCTCCRGSSLNHNEAVTMQHLRWRWLGCCCLQLPLLFSTAISKVSVDRGSLVLRISTVVNMSSGKGTILNKGFDSKKIHHSLFHRAVN